MSSACPEDFLTPGLLPLALLIALPGLKREGVIHSLTHLFIHSSFTHSFIHSFIIHALIYSFKSLIHSLARSFTDALIHPFTHPLSFIHSLSRLPIPALQFWSTTPSIHFCLCRLRPTPHPLHNYLHCLGSCLPHPLPWLECQLPAILS